MLNRGDINSRYSGKMCFIMARLESEAGHWKPYDKEQSQGVKQGLRNICIRKNYQEGTPAPFIIFFYWHYLGIT